MKNPGARPNEMTSQSESNCFPMSEAELNKREKKPSKTSNITAIITQIKLISSLPSNKDNKAIQPEKPLRSVIKFGIILNKDIL